MHMSPLSLFLSVSQVGRIFIGRPAGDITHLTPIHSSVNYIVVIIIIIIIIIIMLW